MKKLHKVLAFCGASALAITAQAAKAQSAEFQGEVLAEIVVTAQKREASVNTVPMTISALTSNQLEKQGVRSGEDLVKVVPALTFTQTQFDAPVYTLRGIGFYESSLAANPAVSVYVDEVPVTYPAMTRGVLLDLERVEVLKGPQGTLFGQNSTGGAISYIAAKPTATPRAGFDISYGRFDTLDLNGYVSGPLSQTVSARVAVAVTQGGPWQQSQTRDVKLGETDQLIGRVLLEWRPQDNFVAALNVNGWRDRSETQAPQVIGIYPAVPNVPLHPQIANHPLAGDNARQADWDPGVDLHRDNAFFQTALRADWEISDTLKLTSISSFERFTRDGNNEADGTPITDVLVGLGGHINSFSQELRLAGEAGEKLRWIVGANYQDDEIIDTQNVNLEEATNSQLFGLSFGPVVNLTTNDVTTKAVFGNVNYKLDEKLSFEAGLRYTASKNSFSGCTKDSGDGRLAAIFQIIQSAFPTPPTGKALAGGCATIINAAGDAGFTRAVLDQDNVSWRLGANWQPASGALIYGNVSKGYKAGNFPNLSASAGVQFAPITQEDVLAYEIGFKKSLADRTIQLNGAVFYYDYNDKQLRGRILDPFFGQLEALVNIPKSHIYGGELQMQWSPLRGLQISTAASYTKSEVDRFTGFGQFGAAQDFAGSAFPYTPKWQLTANADYRLPERGGLTPFVGGGLSYNSKTYGSLGAPEQLKIDGYALVDLRAGVEGKGGDWRAYVWGRNVTDAYYWQNALVLNDTIVRYAGRPATWGATLGYKF